MRIGAKVTIRFEGKVTPRARSGVKLTVKATPGDTVGVTVFLGSG